MRKKKAKHKLVIFSLITVLLLSMSVQSFAETSPFTDIENTKSKSIIEELYAQGVVKGMGNGLFNPDGVLTSAQGVQIIVNAFDISLASISFIKAPLATDYFAKANDNAWYADALIIAGANSIGLPADLDPNAQWTKEEFTYYMITAMESHYDMPATDLMYIVAADDSEMGVEYQGAIQRSMKHNITALDQDDKFYPKKLLTRAEAAEMISNGRKLVQEMNLEMK